VYIVVEKPKLFGGVPDDQNRSGDHAQDDKDQMFWFDASLSQEWGKIVAFNKEWDLTKPQYLTFNPDTHLLGLTSSKKNAPNFFYEMRDNTLLTKSNTGLIERVSAEQLKKWANVLVKPMQDNLAEEDKMGQWHIEYCYLEAKPNPEAANEKIPQTTMMKAFPDGWYKTGEFDYEEMSSVSSLWALVFFLIYVLVMFFIVLNIFLAILNDAYTTTKEEVKGNDFHLPDGMLLQGPAPPGQAGQAVPMAMLVPPDVLRRPPSLEDGVVEMRTLPEAEHAADRTTYQCCSETR